MTKRLFVATLLLAISGLQFALAQSNGNPLPGVPHDTIMFHVMKVGQAARQCDGGHSLFLHPLGSGAIPKILIYITMIDWFDADGNLSPYDANGIEVEPGVSRRG